MFLVGVQAESFEVGDVVEALVKSNVWRAAKITSNNNNGTYGIQTLFEPIQTAERWKVNFLRKLIFNPGERVETNKSDDGVVDDCWERAVIATVGEVSKMFQDLVAPPTDNELLEYNNNLRYDIVLTTGERQRHSLKKYIRTHGHPLKVGDLIFHVEKERRKNGVVTRVDDHTYDVDIFDNAFCFVETKNLRKPYLGGSEIANDKRRLRFRARMARLAHEEAEREAEERVRVAKLRSQERADHDKVTAFMAEAAATRLAEVAEEIRVAAAQKQAHEEEIREAEANAGFGGVYDTD